MNETNSNIGHENPIHSTRKSGGTALILSDKKAQSSHRRRQTINPDDEELRRKLAFDWRRQVNKERVQIAMDEQNETMQRSRSYLNIKRPDGNDRYPNPHHIAP